MKACEGKRCGEEPGIEEKICKPEYIGRLSTECPVDPKWTMTQKELHEFNEMKKIKKLFFAVKIN